MKFEPPSDLGIPRYQPSETVTCTTTRSRPQNNKITVFCRFFNVLFGCNEPERGVERLSQLVRFHHQMATTKRKTVMLCYETVMLQPRHNGVALIQPRQIHPHQFTHGQLTPQTMYPQRNSPARYTQSCATNLAQVLGPHRRRNVPQLYGI